MKPLARVSTNWSHDLAYAIGLITTDGCLYNDGRHLNLTSKDLQLIKTFKKCLGLKNKVGLKSSGFSKPKIYHNLQFGDKNFYNFLLGIGLKPAKSKTLNSLIIPDKFFPDFLRGCFDGDGCIYSYWDKRWHSSYMFYVGFASASLPFLRWLQSQIFTLINVKGHINTTKMKERTWFQLKFAKREGRVLIEKMYYSNSVPLLKRKFRKIIKILKIDNRHNNI